ncbi:Small GTPase superfamily [Macleaya cordata]|uniref:Small GTPase superfamily n=1 Tax=Macleaya cordata TaxID=56857 RepID=A0A200QKQ6_MACCD|nr:Small GTPase superfamily [Macleaya cordata]
MTKLLCRKFIHIDIKWRLLKRVSFFRQFFRFLCDRVLICSLGKQPHRFRRLHRSTSSPFPVGTMSTESGSVSGDPTTTCTSHDYDTDSDLVALKISLLGDCQIGKTSFVIKCLGSDQEKRCLKMSGLNLVDKIFSVRGARIAFSIWDVGGDHKSLDHVPIACKDAVAILIMFDLTSRSTLNSVIGWYQQARKYNQTAIPILIGTKFDDFVQLPLAMQWAIVNQARTYAQAMQATLFFSSSTHNININKIFKFITAKLFNLPWTVERNLNIGEPIIDF